MARRSDERRRSTRRLVRHEHRRRARLGALDRDRDAPGGRAPRRRSGAGDHRRGPSPHLTPSPRDRTRSWRSAPSRSRTRGRDRSERTSVSATSWRRSSSRTRSGSTSSASASTTGPSSPCRRLRWCWPPPRQDDADPAHERRDRPQLGRPGPRVPGVLDRRPHLARPSGDHGRPRLLHRVVPAVRIRPPRLRPAVRTEARRAPPHPRDGNLADRPRACIPAPSRIRSRYGSRSAARPSLPCARGCSACRWRSRSSAACRSVSSRSPSSIAAQRPRRATSHRD